MVQQRAAAASTKTEGKRKIEGVHAIICHCLLIYDDRYFAM